MKSSIQIHNELLELDGKIAQAEKQFNAADADAKDALRDSINQYKGEQKSLNDMLGDVLNEEDRIRKAGGVPVAQEAPKAEFKPRNLAQMALGARDAFKGLEVGDRKRFDVLDAYTEFGLAEHSETDYTLPRQTSDALPNFGILSTLPKATTSTDILTFFECDPTKYVNNAATWEPGNVKPESSMAWTQRSAHMELIANGMPVLETNLKDYGSLQSLINTELLYMQNMVKAAKVIKAPKSNADKGIVGIVNHDGVLTRTKGSKETLADVIRKMKTDIFLASGFQPTTVAMHPYVAESIELEKDANQRYINMMVNGKLWALQVVEDLNLSETTETSTTYGMMAYLPQAATFFNRESESIEVGIVNDQFMRNELTIRLEGRYGLKVTYPKAFCYVADCGISR